ncbi:MAG: glycosyltransferase family 39 protein [Candidatus Omnitrophica bacterium]|nr:glycosyltransferase family 39 protein [Candidatus Omnitrophota bacterium]
MNKKNITIFFIVYFTCNLIWLYRDLLPPSWDQAHHMLLSLRYFRLMPNMWLLHDVRNFLSVSHYYPPFFHLSSIPVIFLLGFSESSLILTNVFYSIILIVSLLGIVRYLFNEQTGLWSILLLLLYPMIYAMLREYLIDFALVAMVAATQYLILKSEGGIKKRWNLLLGVVVGFTLLTKSVSVIFFIPLWIFTAIKNFNKSRDFIPIFISILISAVIAGPWYLASFKDMIFLNDYWQKFAINVEGDINTFIPSVFWYIGVIKDTMISPILSFVLLIGTACFFLFDRRKEVLVFLMTCSVPAFLLLSLTPNKDARYIMPCLPIFAMLTMGGICAIPKKVIRRVALVFITIVACVQFVNLSFGVPPFLVKRENFFYNHSPLQYDWKIKEILGFISKRFGRENIAIGFLPDSKYFNLSAFIFYTNLFNLPYSVEYVGNSNVEITQIDKYDVFITKSPNVAVPHKSFYRNKFNKEMDVSMYNDIGFKALEKFELPDNTIAFVYYKVKESND